MNIVVYGEFKKSLENEFTICILRYIKKIKVMLREEIKNGLNHLCISLFMILIIIGEICLFVTNKVEFGSNLLTFFSIVIIINSFFVLLNNSDLTKDSYKRIISIIKVNKLK